MILSLPPNTRNTSCPPAYPGLSHAPPVSFYKHTCKPICINVHESIRAQVSAHVHGSGAALTCALPLKAALCLSSRAVTFAAWLVLHGSTFRFRKKHGTSSRDQHALTRRLMCACLQASTSLVQLACHSLAPHPCSVQHKPG